MLLMTFEEEVFSSFKYEKRGALRMELCRDVWPRVEAMHLGELGVLKLLRAAAEGGRLRLSEVEARLDRLDGVLLPVPTDAALAARAQRTAPAPASGCRVRAPGGEMS